MNMRRQLPVLVGCLAYMAAWLAATCLTFSAPLTWRMVAWYLFCCLWFGYCFIVLAEEPWRWPAEEISG